MLIFKTLQRAVDSVNETLSALPVEDDFRDSWLAKRDALQELVDYVNSYDWLKQNKAKDKVKAILKSNYNYSQVAIEYGTSVASLQSSLSIASKTLEKKIGETTIDLIMSGDVETGLTQFKVGSDTATSMSLIMDDVIEKLPKAKFEVGLAVSDCSKELRFLQYFTHKKIDANVSSLDQSKVSFLRYILESNDSKYSYERQLIHNFLLGENGFSLEEVIEQIKEVNSYVNQG